MPTEDPELLKARETARSISIEQLLDGDFISALEAITAALLRAQADGVEKANELGQFDSMSRYAKRLRALADREEGE